MKQLDNFLSSPMPNFMKIYSGVLQLLYAYSQTAILRGTLLGCERTYNQVSVRQLTEGSTHWGMLVNVLTLLPLCNIPSTKNGGQTVWGQTTVQHMA